MSDRSITEPRATIRNPLTVIAIFAGLAETGGTIVLPFLADDIQGTYVWFLMFFPILLVLCFFGLLTFRHHVLYAPSDFKNEEIFERGLRPASVNLVEKKLQEEVEADEQSAPDDSEGGSEGKGNVIEPTPEANDASQKIEISDDAAVIVGGNVGSVSESSKRIAQAYRAENYAISKIRREFGVDLVRNVRSDHDPRFVIDAVGRDGSRIFYFEIKFSSRGVVLFSAVRSAILQLRSLYERMPSSERATAHFVLVYVLGTDSDERVRTAYKFLELRKSEADFPFDFRIYKLSEHLLG